MIEKYLIENMKFKRNISLTFKIKSLLILLLLSTL
jgi:hypothetical protein